MSERAPYSRVYWSVRYDERLVSIYCDDHHFAAWMRLLLDADMAWPAPASLPAGLRRQSRDALVREGVIELLPGGMFRFHGLDAEREHRRNAAASSAGVRWGSERNADGMRTHTERNASRAETRQEETSTPQPPTGGGRRSERTNPRALAAEITRKAEQAEADRKARRKARQVAYLDGRLTEAQRDDMDERDADLAEIPAERGAAYKGAA